MNFRNFLKGFIYMSLAVVPFLAWYVSESTFFPFITGKNFAFRSIIEMVLIAYVALAYLEPQYRPKKSIVFYTYSAFLLVLFVANIFGANPYLSFFGNYERMEGWFTHLHLFLYFTVLYSVFKTEHDWTKMLGWFMVSGVAVITEGTMQLLGSKDFLLGKFSFTSKFIEIMGAAYPTHMGTRLDSTLGNAAYYGIYSLLFVFLASLFAFKINKWNKFSNQNFRSIFYVVLGAILVLSKNLFVYFYTATNSDTLYFLGTFLAFVGWIVFIASGVSFVKSLSRNEVGSWPFALFGFVSLVSLAYTQTRGSYFGLIGGAIVASLLYAFSKKGEGARKIRNIIVSLVAIILIAFSFIFLLKDSSIVKNSVVLSRIATIRIFNIISHPVESFDLVADEKNNYKTLLDYFGEATIVSRFLNAKMGIEGIKESPKTFILGYGQENYSTVFANKFDPRMYQQEAWFDRAHDVFMDWLVAGGILGLVTYLALYLTSIYMLWFAKGKTNIALSERALLTGALVAYFIHNIFVFDNLVSYIMFVILLAYIASRTRDTDSHIKSEVAQKGKRDKMIGYGVMLLATIVSFTMFVTIVLRPLATNIDIITAFRNQPTSYDNLATSSAAMYKNFVNGYNRNTFGSQELVEQMLQKGLNLFTIDTNNVPTSTRESFVNTATNFVNFSESAMLTQLKDYPSLRSLSLYGAYLSQKGDNINALKYLKQAYEMSPNKQAVAFEYIRVLLSSKNITEALTVAKKAYEADPSFDQAKNIYDLLQKEVASSTISSVNTKAIKK